MARYTGPVFRKSRRYKFSILETNKEFLKGKKRTSAPGQHGERRSKLSNYGEHLHAKQQVKFMYGLGERQMKNTFQKATKMQGVLGTNFLILLESRLDNVVYRMGVANTRRQSRQFVNHGLILVNGRKVDIPSYQVKPGDEISLKAKLSKNLFVLDNLKHVSRKAFVSFDETSMKGIYTRVPERSELSQLINDSFIVEFYNK